ncbi:putative Mitochondrial zinc maintenance protein 1, mitochondrial [Seiridium cardinale]|uniref:Mitochondrial zinc maintenance protein 1, mitochondrial n=1 Tax=Seiridium cardinale TaxID=138064 RepID=A0ABR2X886_9PEZI
MAKQAVSAQSHLLKALNRWPKDIIRPTVQFQEVLKKRFEAQGASLSEEEKLRQANALYSLLDNRYKKKYPITGEQSLLKPRSKPTYFADLVREMEEAPNRSWFDRTWLRLKGLIRLQ